MQTALADEAGGDLLPPIEGNFIILGVGAGPEYLGSADDIWAVGPAARYEFKGIEVILQATYLTADILQDPTWSFGPSAVYRFGRSDVQNAQVAALPPIDPTIDVGLFGGYTWNTDDLRRRGGVSISTMGDIGGVHNGFVVSAGVRQWVPVGRFGAIGFAAGTTWGSDAYTDTYFSVDPAGAAASGLPVFQASSGQRDARVAAVFVQPVSLSAAVGAGVLCGRLLDDAGRSPITTDPTPCYAGVGVARVW
jgi:outer membrane scaffolding protein for murein synthesis (MipA/OmpV family)